MGERLKSIHGEGQRYGQWLLAQLGKVALVVVTIAIFLTTSGMNPAIAQVNIAQVNVSPDFEAKVLKVIDDNPEAILKSVGKFNRIQAERRAQYQSQFRLSVRTNPESIIATSPVKGNTDAAITLIEFSDFQCPFCARAQGELQRFMSRYGNRVQLVYKHLPLSSVHPQAIPAAAASWAAQQQDKFWPFHDALFKNQDRLGEDLYLELVQQLNLDLEQFNRDRQSDGARQALQSDIELAASLEIQGTPTFIMDGVILTQAPTFDNLTAAYQSAAAQR